MSDTEMAALLQAVFDEICADLAPGEIAIRQRVAARILEAARNEQWSIADLKRAGREALRSPPTMWR
jgi:hypothetical protein